MAKSTKSAPAEDFVHGLNTLVCVIDLTGFTLWVDEEVSMYGAGRLEAIADDLSAFLASASSILTAEGFLLASLLGDGLLAVRFHSPDDDAVQARICASLRRLEPRARLAFGVGSIERRTFAGLAGTNHTILAGEAVRRCYEALEGHPRTAGRRRPPAPVPPSIARFGTAEICHLVIGFMAFQAHDFATLSNFVDQNLPIWQAHALATGGSLDRLSYDDDALLVRFVWPVAAVDAAWVGGHLAAQLGTHPDGMKAGWGAASGPVFRAQLAGGSSLNGEDMNVAQGPAINHAAKQAKRMLEQGTVNTSLPSNTRAHQDVLCKELVGRAVELDWISGRINAGSRLIMVTGEAGIGKSSLIETASRAQSDTISVLAVSAQPGDILEPLGLWRTVSRIDKFASVDDQFSSLLVQLTDRAAQRLLLIVVDDLQWADPYSLRMIDELIRKVPSITILAAGRPGASAFVGNVDADDHLYLRGMPADDIAMVAQAYSVAPSPQILSLAGGNPFLAVQLALSWRSDDGVHDLPGSRTAVIDVRLARLPASSISALRLFAVVDRQLDISDLERVYAEAGLTFDVGALQVLREEGFLETGDRFGTLAITHRLIQQRIVEQIPPSAMQRISAVIARLLRDGLSFAPGLGVVGEHLRNAQQWSRAAISDFSDAERALAIHAHGPAAELFERALAGLERVGANADRLALVSAAHGLAAWGLGDVATALDASANTAIALAGAIPLRVRARAVVAIITGRRHLLPPRLALALVRQAALRSELGYFTGKLSDILAGGLVVSRLGDDRAASQVARTRSIGLLALGLGMLGLDRTARGIFIHCQRSGGDRLPAAYAFCAEALYRFAQGAWVEGDRCIHSSEARLGEPRDFHLQGALLCVRALSLHMRGASAEASMVFGELLILGQQRGNRQFEAWALYGGAMPLIAVGRVAEAAAQIEAASALMTGNADLLSTLNCRALRAQLAWIAGDAAGAIDHIEICLDLSNEVFPANFGSLDGFTLPALIIADIISSESTAAELFVRAQKLVPTALARAQKFASHCAIGAPRLAAARAALARNNVLRHRHWTRMVQLSRSLGMPPRLARAIPAESVSGKKQYR